MGDRRRDEVRKLNRETAKFAVSHFIDDAKRNSMIFRASCASRGHPHRSRRKRRNFRGQGRRDGGGETRIRRGPFDRYEVNVLVARGRRTGVPVIEELHPTLGNLLGSIEYFRMHGALVTNFRLIKAGAMHRANGGYLLIDAAICWGNLSVGRHLNARCGAESAIEDLGRFLRLCQHGVARAGSDPAGPQGRPVWRSAAVFPSGRPRPGTGRAFQSAGGFRERLRP